MKVPMKCVLCCAVMALGTPVFAQTADYGSLSESSRERERTSSQAGESQKFTKSKDLVGANIKDSQGNELGSISELYVNPKSGETFASVGIENGRHALVPVQALKVTRPAGMLRDAEVTLNMSKEKLESGPAVARDEWNKLDQQEFVQSIYSHYDIQQPSSAMGGSELEQSSDPMKSNKHKDKEHKEHKPDSDLDSSPDL